MRSSSIPRPIAAIVLVAAIPAACDLLVPPLLQEEPEDVWGPLTVSDDPREMEAATGGIVRIDRECVYLEGPRVDTLLVWPEARTNWEPPGAILFERNSGDVVLIQNGQRVALGGGGANELFEWVNPPDPTCPSEKWLVSDVVPPE